MGKKSKKHANRQSADDTFQYAQRAMEKQDFKEALKNAKVCFRQDPSHDHRQILERSWLARGLQLARAGLQTEGRAAAQELLAMGVSQPDVQQGLPELLLAVGLYDQAVAAGKIPGGRRGRTRPFWPAPPIEPWPTRLTAPASLPGIREGATMIRAALDGLDAGDEGAALAALGDVPRNSPFAEWKLFVRGLAAYYRHDDEAMRANWDRLAPDRFAARLAAPLRRLADPARQRLATPPRSSAARTSSVRRFASWSRTSSADRWSGISSPCKRAWATIIGARPCPVSAAGRRSFRPACRTSPSGSIASSTTWRFERPTSGG